MPRDVGFLVLPQHIEGAHQHRPPRHRKFETAQLEAQPRPFQRLGRRTRSGSISIPHHPHVRADGGEAVEEFDGGGRRRAVAQVDDQRICRGRAAARPAGPASQRSTRRIRLGLVVPRVTLPTGLPPRRRLRSGGPLTRSPSAPPPNPIVQRGALWRPLPERAAEPVQVTRAVTLGTAAAARLG